MNNRPKHLQYRKNIYRRKRTKAIAVIVGAALIVLFVLFLIIGNALHNKTAEEEPTDYGSEDSSMSEENSSLPAADTVGAYALPLLEDGSAFSSRLDAIPEDAGAVCINLNSEDGLLLYRSELISEFSFLQSSGDATSLSNSISSIKDRNLHASALLHIPSFSEEDDLAREIQLTAWCAVAVEAIRAGVDDCLIMTSSAGVNDIEKLCSLANLIHDMEDGAIVGIVIPEEVLSVGNSEALISKLSSSYNFLAINAANPKEDEDVAMYVETRIARMQVQLIYHKMRALLPTADDAPVMKEYIDTVKKYNVSSWQFLP